jgi:hypothetical protein
MPIRVPALRLPTAAPLDTPSIIFARNAKPHPRTT